MEATFEKEKDDECLILWVPIYLVLFYCEPRGDAESIIVNPSGSRIGIAGNERKKIFSINVF